MFSPLLNSRVLCLVVIGSLSIFADSLSAERREWSDATGRYKWEAELFTASSDTAVLRNRRGQLQAVRIEELSEGDQKHVKEYLDKLEAPTGTDMQTWTSRKGFKVRGRVLGYKSGPVEIEFRNGDVVVNDKRYREIDSVYKAMLPQLVAEADDSTVEDEDDFRLWARRLRGKSQTIQVDGVLMRFENGDEYALPLFIFSEQDRRVLETGWQTWANEETTRVERQREDLLIRAEAEDYQRRQDQEAAENRQIQMMQMALLATQAGVTNLWEVLLTPPGGRGRSFTVIVPAINSSAAANAALQKYPGYIVSGARQASRGRY